MFFKRHLFAGNCLKSTFFLPTMSITTQTTAALGSEPSAYDLLINDLNTHHKYQLFDILLYYATKQFEVDPQSPRADVRVLDIARDSLTLEFKTPFFRLPTRARVAIAPPLQPSFTASDARDRLLNVMAPTAALQLGWTNTRDVDSQPLYALAPYTAVSGLVYLGWIVNVPLVRDTLFEAIGVQQWVAETPLLKFLFIDHPWSIMGAMLAIHAAELLLVGVPVMAQARVRKWTTWVPWSTAVLVEGYPAIKRFKNSLIEKV